MDKITPEALEAAGWVNEGDGRFELPSRDYFTFFMLKMNDGDTGAELHVSYEGCHDTIGYALTMSEINTIAAVAKRTPRKE